ncbi:hypothetical protein ABB37_04889 [Leptomonas pyrrhocoris]|uniref:Secreted protein n=1 Tax=Leptomonas pyrrhocoris TaxID=157538 RepID=A0A0M9G1W7_LEPPY|nr:hypothetical protein ABB37_04889 [Leptomonas pyrrhocoris]KPA80720.1 hypothetical protein ABB37_04889 [Leptomonas pyrrhocoris]|eukprot:XP_015659159.1 hypothetical protein ABB37_04889 [Leptomonas pyrrhocoris]
MYLLLRRRAALVSLFTFMAYGEQSEPLSFLWLRRSFLFCLFDSLLRRVRSIPFLHLLFSSFYSKRYKERTSANKQLKTSLCAPFTAFIYCLTFFFPSLLLASRARRIHYLKMDKLAILTGHVRVKALALMEAYR